MKYIGIDGESYGSITELAEANKRIENDPLYVKEMRRRALVNQPGKITREEWQKLKSILEPVREKVEKYSPIEVVEFEKGGRSRVKSEKPVAEPSEKRKYSKVMPDEYRSVMRRANAKGIGFDLNVEQVESLLEKKCHFCGVESMTLITTGKKFDYPNSKGVCQECKSVHDLLGDGMGEYLDRFVK